MARAGVVGACLVTVVALTGCGSTEAKAQFINDCANSIEVMADEWSGEQDPEIFADLASWSDQVIVTLEPGQAWQATRMGAPDDYVAVVLYPQGQDVYFWSVTPDNGGVFEVSGSQCPPE